jgi:hypothetical protein
VAPNFIGDQTTEAFRQAVTPSDADVLAAKAEVRSRMQAAPVTVRELIVEVVEALGIPHTNNLETYDVLPNVDPVEAIDPEHPAIKRQRLAQAVRLAVADLAAEGLIVPGKVRDQISVRVHRAGTTGSISVPAHTPELVHAYRAKPSLRSLLSAPTLTTEEFAAGLGTLLTPRALECLAEALAAFRRGLYLSAVNLLGAVSEAAWYRLAELLEPTVPELTEALANNRTGEIQRLVAKVFVDHRGRARSMTNELVSHASYLRDLRNYGVHPYADEDPGQSHAFTETGCLLLVIESHRYLARLREAGELAGLDLSSPSN